jgi:hypothetical protein
MPVINKKKRSVDNLQRGMFSIIFKVRAKPKAWALGNKK